MKVDYSKAKIYKITNDFNNDIWIGTTCDTLVKKFSVHKADAIRNFRKDCIIHNLIREHGFDRFRIQLIEDFPCEDLYQLRQRQGHHIRDLNAINKYADQKDYREKNKERISEHYKEYSQDSSRRRAPAAADTEWIEGAFIKPGQRARVGGPGQSLRPARIELAPPERRAHRAGAELRRGRTVPLRRTQRRLTARRS